MEKKVELTVQFSCGCGWVARKDGTGAMVTLSEIEGSVTGYSAFPAQKMALGHAEKMGHTLTITGLVRANVS